MEQTSPQAATVYGYLLRLLFFTLLLAFIVALPVLPRHIGCSFCYFNEEDTIQEMPG